MSDLGKLKMGGNELKKIVREMAKSFEVEEQRVLDRLLEEGLVKKEGKNYVLLR